MLNDGRWDIRVPSAATKLFPDRSKPYYWKINFSTASKLLQILSDAYNVAPPKVKVSPGMGSFGAYNFQTKTVHMHGRNHIKTIVHEFYHHLDGQTNRKYNSDDRDGGATSLAWQFADRWWQVFARIKP